MDELILTPSEFVALTNQVLETAYPQVIIEGELSELRVSKQRWVYLKLKDQEAVVDFFGTVYQLKHPLEDGMMVRVTGQPKLSPKWGFSVNIQQITPIGEGSIRRSFELLKAKLSAEGLFDDDKKRPLPEFPKVIGLISSESAAGATDFLTVLNQRWGGVKVKFAQVQVQGEAAASQIVAAIDYFNALSRPVDVLVLTRGGGGLEDLLPFDTEAVARAVAGSASPIVVGVGHEKDVTLADLAADVRAATPTQAASLIVPDRNSLDASLKVIRTRLSGYIQQTVIGLKEAYFGRLNTAINLALSSFEQKLAGSRSALAAFDPQAALKRGYSILSRNGRVVSSVKGLAAGDTIDGKLSDGQITAQINQIN